MKNEKLKDDLSISISALRAGVDNLRKVADAIHDDDRESEASIVYLSVDHIASELSNLMIVRKMLG